MSHKVMRSIIVAFDQQGVIGQRGALPWRLSADLVRFKRLTMGHTLVMGRKTFESIGRPLPGRASIVITRQSTYTHPGVQIAASLDEALQLADKQREVFVIGGQSIYQLAIPRVDRLYVTRVLADVEGDTWFPEMDWSEWELQETAFQPADDRNQYDSQFEVYCRITR